jgi:hypothetical protein
MVDLLIRISDDVFAQLEEKALEAQKPVEEVAAALLEENLQYHYDETRDPFLLVAKAAEAAGIQSDHGDIAERSRELLEHGFPDYLTNRQRELDDESK